MAGNFKENIVKLVEPIASAAAEPLGLKVLRMIVRGSEQTPVIEIIIDGEKPVMLEDCAVVSRQVNETLEDSKIVKGNFRLDVMSPGVDDPLTELYQYKRNIGRLIKIQTKEDHQDKTLLGRLTSVDGENITIETTSRNGQKKEKETIDLESIKTAVVQVEFNPRSTEDDIF